MESGRYQFHSRVDLQSYQSSGTKHTKDKKGKKKRKEPEWIAADEYKVTSELTENAKSVGFLSMMQLTGCGAWFYAENVCLLFELFKHT